MLYSPFYARWIKLYCQHSCTSACKKKVKLNSLQCVSILQILPHIANLLVATIYSWCYSITTSLSKLSLLSLLCLCNHNHDSMNLISIAWVANYWHVSIIGSLLSYYWHKWFTCFLREFTGICHKMFVMVALNLF